jgi:hypothetical protein
MDTLPNLKRAIMRGLGTGRREGERLKRCAPDRTLYPPAARPPPVPWWLLAAAAGRVLALLIYVLAAALVLAAIIYLAVKVYRWLEGGS